MARVRRGRVPIPAGSSRAPKRGCAMRTAEVEADGSGRQGREATGSLFESLKGIVDVRKRRGVRYPLASTLALCVVAFICGRQNLTQVRRFGRDHQELLDELEFPRRKAPSVPTLSRVLGQVQVAELQEALARWIGGLVDTERKRERCAVAAVDGKTTRAAG